ncbi:MULTISPECIES: phosphatase PAP2 family protein [unclassified Leucobacter]|uniref:phosphatase PAP2 family protein n=1 Tax=unclassified Leucobacter TaxID=2621730 RepID=UPI00165E97BC|nr:MULTISPECIES: phosphatase PAP2 family protein [unclassified Leucobacter]MBC9937353.1 phosphatase PAP2 family protein [Leucobacter sp. cx-87]
MSSNSDPAGPLARPSPRYAALIGAVLVLLVAAGGVYFFIAGSGPLPVDSWWHAHVGAAPGTALHAIAAFLAIVGGQIGALVCFVIAFGILILARRGRDALAVGFAGVLGVAGSEILKRLVQRPRPPEQFFSSHGYSYPSGHSMAAAALAVSLALVALGARDLDRRLSRAATVLAIAWTLVMMWSRTALHVHWLSDTLAGAALGIGAALIARRLCVPPKPTVSVAA